MIKYLGEPRPTDFTAVASPTVASQASAFTSMTKKRISILQPSEHVHELGDLLALLVLLARSDRMSDAVGDVILDRLFLDSLQRGVNGRQQMVIGGRPNALSDELSRCWIETGVIITNRAPDGKELENHGSCGR